MAHCASYLFGLTPFHLGTAHSHSNRMVPPLSFFSWNLACSSHCTEQRAVAISKKTTTQWCSSTLLQNHWFPKLLQGRLYWIQSECNGSAVGLVTKHWTGNNKNLLQTQKMDHQGTEVEEVHTCSLPLCASLVHSQHPESLYLWAELKQICGPKPCISWWCKSPFQMFSFHPRSSSAQAFPPLCSIVHLWLIIVWKWAGQPFLK